MKNLKWCIIKYEFKFKLFNLNFSKKQLIVFDSKQKAIKQANAMWNLLNVFEKKKNKVYVVLLNIDENLNTFAKDDFGRKDKHWYEVAYHCDIEGRC